ncbi:succinate dehydrogenase, hydrophobic membrane anchor protein [Alteromonas sp. 5E99-2]|uniref:succinate dehydrogenase, hydrophobic membrane anchor protein n=1 Tax=Alteromonas sp. 5E99-2 TaxID=2817683 RepID=UPI001A98A567|nr:succinate dehydrogenase, hydrophobic membrane anchor protein [Alteromonas sp. 5E99-2]MBO1255514.1 succinate dehydrogenase, hydrophobic membrane anchor protein [Alteromonas sp. 5E99-2]
MVTNQANIKRNGIQDYVSIRATAAIIAAFTLYLAFFFITTDDITYEIWKGLFSTIGMKVFTLAALVAVMIHTRIGLWQVLTDYIKAPGLRAVLQYVLNLIGFVYVAVGLFVLWGV